MCIHNPSLLQKGDKLIRGDPSIDKKWNTRLSSMGHFRESLQNSCQMLGEKVHSVLTIRPGKNVVCVWCSERNVDPCKCNLTFVLDLLSHLFEKGLE